MKKIKFHYFILLVQVIFSSQVFATSPILHFSDLVSGPDTGIGDEVGSGVIVTIWGQHLGDSQGASTIVYKDSGDVERNAHVYYWKRADGQLPSGPSNLYASHGMQEIALSIPDSSEGLGTIQITVSGESSSLPFTVRSGNIYHVKSTGSDSEGDGSFASAWQTIEKAIEKVDDPGSTIYIHNVDIGCDDCKFGIKWDNPDAGSSLEAQFGFIAYPNTRPTSTGARGITNRKIDGQVVSKLDFYSSNYLSEDENGQFSNNTQSITMCIESDRFGRAVANRCTDIPGGCASAQGAAIVGNAIDGDNEVGGYQILGNEIYDYGCEGTRKFHHTTYLTVRSADLNLQVKPWRFGWNYLHGNHAKNGIHMFDESFSTPQCGSPTGTVIINDNVVIDQGGAGISIASNCPWISDFDVYNNLLINTGLAADWDGIDPTTSDGAVTSAISISDDGLMGTINIFNNTIIGWNADDNAEDAQACLGLKGTGDNVTILYNNNVCSTIKDKAFVDHGCCGAEVQLDNVTGGNNVWFFDGLDALKAVAPDWDAAAVNEDPLISNINVKYAISTGSSTLDANNSSALSDRDIYGFERGDKPEIGAFEFTLKPNSPSNLLIK